MVGSAPAKTAAAATAPVVVLTSDWGDNTDAWDISPYRKLIRRSENLPGSSHPPYTSPGLSTNHNAFVTDSAPLPIDIEELDISIWTTRPTSARCSKSLSKNASVQLTEERILLLQRFLQTGYLEAPCGIWRCLLI